MRNPKLRKILSYLQTLTNVTFERCINVTNNGDNASWFPFLKKILTWFHVFVFLHEGHMCIEKQMILQM